MIEPFHITLFAIGFKLFFYKERLQLFWHQTNLGILYVDRGRASFKILYFFLKTLIIILK